MFNAIVTQPDEDRNFGFESLTSDERTEYHAWSDAVNAQVPDPDPDDLRMSSLELTEQDLAKEARDYDVPVDDPMELANDGWHRIFSECSRKAIEAVAQMSTEGRAKVIADQIRFNLAGASLNRTIALLEARE